SDGKCLAARRNKLVAHACRPRFEPTRFIMNSVAGQKPLSHKANESSIHSQRCAVEETVLVQGRQPERHDHSAGFRQEFLERSPRSLMCIGRVERIFASVTREAEFGQANHDGASIPRHLDRLTNVGRVVLPVERCLIQHASRYVDEFHGIASLRGRSGRAPRSTSKIPSPMNSLLDRNRRTCWMPGVETFATCSLNFTL